MSVQIRNLTRKDRKIFAELIKKLVEKTDQKELISMVPSSSVDSEEQSKESKSEQTANILQFAFNLLEGFLQFIEEDVTKWFMDLAGIETIEEYDALGFDIEVEIINQIIAQQGVANFFSKGSQVAKKIKDLAGLSKISKTLSVLETALPKENSTD